MKKILKVVFFSLYVLSVNGQTIDKVWAIIGDEIVLTSDIESQYLQYLSQGNIKSDQVKCEIIEDILFQKLLINKGKIDSVIITEEQIESEIYSRISYFETQLGTIEKVEEYFGKSKVEIELELNKVIKDQFMAQKVQGSITNDIKVTPAEVRGFFNNQSKSDVPEVPTKFEVKQIVIKPEISDAQKVNLRDKLNSFRSRVYSGEDFKMLATLYSDDSGSSAKGGELGFVNRGDLVPEFERAAFRLKVDEISEVVESKFGFHIIQLIERRGEQINVRHILLKTKVSSTALYDAKIKIGKIEKEIQAGTITFEDAIPKYSDDDNKINGGFLLNSKTMSTMHIIDDMDPKLKYIVENLNIDQVSPPVVIDLADNTKAYRILKLNKKIMMHTANLVDDFSMIKDYSLNIKKKNEIMMWIDETIKKTYIKIDEDILNCTFKNKWIK